MSTGLKDWSSLGMGIETRFYQVPGSNFFNTQKSLTFGLIDTTIESLILFFSLRSCNIMCPSSRITAFKSNQSSHCSVSTNVFEWNCTPTGIKSQIWSLATLQARMAKRAKRAKIIYCKGGNTTSMAFDRLLLLLPHQTGPSSSSTQLQAVIAHRLCR